MKSGRQVYQSKENESRVKGLEIWAEGRAWDLRGQEAYFLDICGCLLMNAYDKNINRVCEQISILNSKLKHSLTPRQLAAVLRRPSVRTPYTYRTETIIKHLGMKKEEADCFKKYVQGPKHTMSNKTKLARMEAWAEGRTWDISPLESVFLRICGNLLMAICNRDWNKMHEQLLVINNKLKVPLDEKEFEKVYKGPGVALPNTCKPETIINLLKMTPEEALAFMGKDENLKTNISNQERLNRLLVWAEGRNWNLGKTRGNFFKLCGVCLLYIDSKTALDEMRKINLNLKLPLLDSYIVDVFSECVNKPLQATNKDIVKMLDMTEKEMEAFEAMA